MKAALVGIPANLFVGHEPARRAVVQHLLSSKLPGERWAILDNDPASGAALPSGPDVLISVVADGCICCNAVGLRVELTRLLSRARPQRLLVLPSRQARIPEVIRLLSDRWLAPVLNLRATIAVVNAADDDLQAAGNADRESLFAGVNIVALETTGTHEGVAGLAHEVLAHVAPHARVVRVVNGGLDPGLLDEPGWPARPMFSSS